MEWFRSVSGIGAGKVLPLVILVTDEFMTGKRGLAVLDTADNGDGVYEYAEPG
jgi:hypothetical protein